MRWYEGTVEAALAEYGSKNALLVVYVRGDNDDRNTVEFDEIWESFDDKILNELVYISIKMDKGSKSAEQFAEFFPTPIFPVCYIMGLSGIPLEVLTPVEPLSIERLKNSFDKSIQAYKNQLKERGLDITNSRGSENIQKHPEDPEKVATQDDSKKSQISPPKQSSETMETPLTDRIEYARQRLEQKRKADEEKKREEEREKEMHRRNEGKLLSELREKNKEKELKDLADARRREKEEDALALKKLREQIKRDREERAKNAEKRSENEEKSASSSIPSQEESTARDPMPVKCDSCRIQCKFPDGSTLLKIFSPNDPLQAVIDAVDQDERCPRPSFLLVQSYPHRQLNDSTRTLSDYNLLPASVLLVVPGTQAVLPAKANYFWLLIGLFYPIVAAFRSIFGFFNFRTNKNDKQNDGREQARTSTTGTAAPGEDSQDEKPQTRQEGRVNRLRRDGDSSDDDENATWNGNSTQQL